MAGALPNPVEMSLNRKLSFRLRAEFVATDVASSVLLRRGCCLRPAAPGMAATGSCLAPARRDRYVTGAERRREAMIQGFGVKPRHRTVGVTIGEGAAAVTVGGGAPIVVQSMTNTDTADIDQTVRRSRRSRAPAPNSCASPSTATRAPPPSPTSARSWRGWASTVPLVGDFHYIGHKLLADHPACAEALGEVPHQSRQCRLQGQEGPAVRR